MNIRAIEGHEDFTNALVHEFTSPSVFEPETSAFIFCHLVIAL